MREKALQYFMGLEGYNCAQAVLKAYQDEHGIQDDKKLREFMMYGGGFAKGGLCGALFAAMSVQENPEMVKQVAQKFASAAGSTKCGDIRMAGKITCRSCVEIAATALEAIEVVEENAN
ncbi:conserved hypothetical protein [Chloroherpeton thalassium ATCC 35110]|uniref:C_GCAxxG_C_C family protein n=1 Tax=Chloroherpeton thalassium (strain ATCC 35110 / GB-78) TaxID=517418 RepID=B3QYS9_CHLT3|nr:C-GCAxxG-C-C family (seleno)protein [Chloroherpeton thalassium]ACF15152.1 conserved hypothetical protein [Chloroherpeton thalassium ATCC 35110]